jgi:EmrB/QacA subfamily drug resistance transporter
VVITMHARQPTPRDVPRPELIPEEAAQPWSVLILLSLAQFMVILDITVVNVALPSIGRSLRFAAADLQWVVTAYVLCTGGLMLLGGRAADLLGRRRVFLTGLGVFTAASLASGLAPTASALVGSRAAQGIGGALLTPAALAIITVTYSGARQAIALSVWGAIASAGAGAGVLIGGMLTTWLGWRSIFLINIPVGAAVGLLSVRLVAPTPAAATGRRRLDLPGALAMVSGLGVLVYAITSSAQHGWGSARTLLLFALAAGLLATSAAIERATARPLLPPQTWRSRSLTAGAWLMLGATGIMVGTFFLNSLYLQNVLGASALKTGLEFLPLVAAIALAAHLASRLLPRTGTRALAVGGLALVAAGSFLLVVAPARATYPSELLPGFILIGLGIGLVFPAASVTAMSEVHSERAGLASGLMLTAHEIGAALGVAVLSAVAAAVAATTVGAGFAAGYQRGFIVGGAAAAALAVISILAVPSVRPARGTRAPIH